MESSFLVGEGRLGFLPNTKVPGGNFSGAGTAGPVILLSLLEALDVLLLAAKLCAVPENGVKTVPELAGVGAVAINVAPNDFIGALGASYPTGVSKSTCKSVSTTLIALFPA